MHADGHLVDLLASLQAKHFEGLQDKTTDEDDSLPTSPKDSITLRHGVGQKRLVVIARCTAPFGKQRLSLVSHNKRHRHSRHRLSLFRPRIRTSAQQILGFGRTRILSAKAFGLTMDGICPIFLVAMFGLLTSK